MSAGYQIAQTAHAVADFALHRPDAFRKWHSESQYVVALQVPTGEHLSSLRQKASSLGLDTVSFHEPDLDHQLTSLAFSPHEKNRRLLANLPLAGK